LRGGDLCLTDSIVVTRAGECSAAFGSSELGQIHTHAMIAPQRVQARRRARRWATSAQETLTSGVFDVLVLFMAHSSASIEPTPDDPESCAQARTARQLATLQELAEIGMQIARAVRDEALARAEAADEDAPARPSPFGAGDLGLIYSRVARAVRQTLALEARIADDLEKAKFEQGRRRNAAIRTALDERQQEIRDYVAEAIEAEAVEKTSPDREVERLLDDLDERLDAGDYDDALHHGPIGELVARICADLGVIPDWDLWDQHDWALDHLKAQTLAGDIGADRWLLRQNPDERRPAPDESPPPPDSG
jgi:hypothetical protein